VPRVMDYMVEVWDLNDCGMAKSRCQLRLMHDAPDVAHTLSQKSDMQPRESYQKQLSQVTLMTPNMLRKQQQLRSTLDVPASCDLTAPYNTSEAAERSAHHLLEVRDVPELVDGVAVEAAAHVVVHPARRHLAQRRQRHLKRLACAR